MSFKIYSPPPEKCKEISMFISTCGVLERERHDPHFYKIIIDYFGETALIAEDEKGRIVGFTFGFASQTDPSLFFLWQIGVAESERGAGLGGQLLARLTEAALIKGCRRMRATVLKDNGSAKRLFEKGGFINLGCFPNFYFEGEDMIVYERDIFPTPQTLAS